MMVKFLKLHDLADLIRIVHLDLLMGLEVGFQLIKRACKEALEQP